MRTGRYTHGHYLSPQLSTRLEDYYWRVVPGGGIRNSVEPRSDAWRETVRVSSTAVAATNCPSSGHAQRSGIPSVHQRIEHSRGEQDTARPRAMGSQKPLRLMRSDQLSSDSTYSNQSLQERRKARIATASTTRETYGSLHMPFTRQ